MLRGTPLVQIVAMGKKEGSEEKPAAWPLSFSAKAVLSLPPGSGGSSMIV